MLLLQVEPGSGTFRIAFRAVHGTVATALREILTAQLEAGGAGGGADAGGIGPGGGVGA